VKLATTGIRKIKICVLRKAAKSPRESKKRQNLFSECKTKPFSLSCFQDFDFHHKRTFAFLRAFAALREIRFFRIQNKNGLAITARPFSCLTVVVFV